MVSNPKPLSEQQLQRFRQAAQDQAAGRMASAKTVFQALIAENVRIPHLFHRLAQVDAAEGNDREAERNFRQALELDPGFFHAEYLLGNLLKAQGRLDEAASCYRNVLARQPEYTQAHFTLAGLCRYEDANDPHIAEMRRLYGKDGVSEEGRIHLSFALAKAFEDLGDHAAAFRYLEEGNKLRARAFDYDISSDRDLVENIIETFSAEAVGRVRARAEDSERPIFIIGMPRSGTSLVEKILSTHSDVHGAGEIEHFYALAAARFLDPQDFYRFRPLDRCPSRSFGRLGREYLRKLEAIDAHALRITDKLPFNLLMAGLVRLALPNARIIHCVRDPRDTCLSIYRQNFTTANYRFAYDLRTIGQFHLMYQGLMRHWHTVFPGAIHDISYEALTSDPEGEIRGLLDVCGLDWQDTCLSFHRSAGTVTTASAVQVRKPMYTSSVGMWKNYEPFLGPLLDELGGG